MRPESVEVYYRNLCSWEFYTEDLSEFYTKYLNIFIKNYFFSDSDSLSVKDCVISGILLYDFKRLICILSSCPSDQLLEIIKLWPNSSVPMKIAESCIYCSFPKDLVLKESAKFINFDSLSSEFKEMLTIKAESSEFDSSIWDSFFRKFGSEKLNFDVESIESVSEFSDIIDNLKSNEVAEIAYGLHILKNNPKLIEKDFNVIEPLFNSLLHEDR